VDAHIARFGGGTVINCAKCGKDNQDHYKFCLGCGAELSKDASPKPFSPNTPPHGVEAVNSTDRPEGAAAEAAGAAGGTVTCPQCSHVNAIGSRFCAGCGYNLSAIGASASPAPAHAAGSGAVLLTALRADGTEAGSYQLPEEPASIIGRDTGSVFAGDSYLSPKHASIARHNGSLVVRDEGSLNGVYFKIQPDSPWLLEFGDVFRIGQEIIRLEALEGQPATPDGVDRLGSPKNGYVGRLALVIGRDTTGNAFPIPQSGVHCGRERGDILFSEDGYVSGLHCRVAPGQDGQLYLTDVGSSNGTFVRLSKEHRVVNGDILLMGQQLFRVDVK
jgi:pSer/pThr/pTyr-binding forkhead associated (FHA) protein